MCQLCFQIYMSSLFSTKTYTTLSLKRTTFGMMPWFLSDATRWARASCSLAWTTLFYHLRAPTAVAGVGVSHWIVGVPSLQFIIRKNFPLKRSKRFEVTLMCLFATNLPLWRQSHGTVQILFSCNRLVVAVKRIWAIMPLKLFKNICEIHIKYNCIVY